MSYLKILTKSCEDTLFKIATTKNRLTINVSMCSNTCTIELFMNTIMSTFFGQLSTGQRLIFVLLVADE